MDNHIIVSEELCHSEVIRYIASRHKTTPCGIILKYLLQAGILEDANQECNLDFALEPNEIAYLHDIGTLPETINSNIR